MARLLGISGSPVQDSNTDRLVKMVLENTREEYEFIKLVDYDINPCLACLQCAGDNVCKQNDDWSELGPKIKEADGFVIGGYSTYNIIDARTKTLMERMYAHRHRELLNQDKPMVAVGLGMEKGIGSIENAVNQITTFAEMEQMNVLGTIKANGNTTCLSCGYGEDCEPSTLPLVFGEGAEVTEDKFTSVEEQDEVVAKAEELGQKMKASLE